MERKSVKSSQIFAVGYDPATKKMQVEFHAKGDKHRSVYEYDNIEPHHHEALVGAESIGTHFGKHIRGNTDKHPYRRIT